MSSGIRVGMRLSDFLLEANRVAGVVIRNADRLSAASGGRIGTHTAEEIRKLREEILEIDRDRERKSVGPIRPLIRRAETLVTEIRTAAKYIALNKPIVAQQLGQLRQGPRKRSSADARWDLEMHLGLVGEHATEFAKILPPRFVDEAERTIAELSEHRESQRAMANESQLQTRKRDERFTRLQAILSEVRALAASVIRDSAVGRQHARRTADETPAKAPKATVSDDCE